MKHIFHHILIAFFISSFISPGIAANCENDAYHNDAIYHFRQILVKNGFQNISIKIFPGKIAQIEYENQRFRYELKALKFVLNQAINHLTQYEKLIVVPLTRNVPILYIHIKSIDFQNYLDGIITEAEFLNKLEFIDHSHEKHKRISYQTEKINTSYFNYDIILNPGFKVQFSRPNDPAQIAINFLPTLHTTLATGLLFQTQLKIPFIDEFGGKTKTPQLGITFINQFIRLPENLFLSLSMGRFDEMRNGFSTEICKFLYNGHFSITTKFDYTTNANNWCDKYELNYLIKAKYFFSGTDLAIDLCWGHSLYDDHAMRIDVIRSFKELNLGFMGVWNDYIGLITGLMLEIPFPVSRQPLPSKIRISHPRYISWKYRYLPYYDGFILNTGTNIETQFKKLIPTHIKNNLSVIKD